MICILGNENRTYSEIYNPICVTCVVCIFMSPKNIYPFLSIDHLPNSQDANPVVINLNSLRYPLETRQALSFVGVSWFLVSYHWNCFYLLIVCPIKCFKVDFPPRAPQKKLKGMARSCFKSMLIFTMFIAIERKPHWWQGKKHPWNVRRWAEVKLYQDSTSEPRITSVLPGEGF